VYLHATPDRKGKRIKFDVKALAEVAAWEKAKAAFGRPSFLIVLQGLQEHTEESISMDILNRALLEKYIREASLKIRGS
jgi:hypothetical protein